MSSKTLVLAGQAATTKAAFGKAVAKKTGGKSLTKKKAGKSVSAATHQPATSTVAPSAAGDGAGDKGEEPADANVSASDANVADLPEVAVKKKVPRKRVCGPGSDSDSEARSEPEGGAVIVETEEERFMREWKEKQEAAEKAAAEEGDDNPFAHQQSDSDKPKFIWVTSKGPEGETKKVQVPRVAMVCEIRRAVAAMASRLASQTELKFEGRPLEDARTRLFQDRDPPYAIEWAPGDRMANLLKRNNLKNMISRAPGTRGLNRTALHFASMQGDSDLVKEILETRDIEPKIFNLVNAQDTYGDTAMMFAAILGFEDLVEVLVDKQTDPEHKNLYGRNALMLAAEHGHHQVVQTLLRIGAKTGPTNPYSKIPNPSYLAELNQRHRVQKVIKEYWDEKRGVDIFAETLDDPADENLPGDKAADEQQTAEVAEWGDDED